MELSLSDRPLGPWLFGKLPSHGDFVSRGLDPALRDAVDQWLSAEMEAARSVTADSFETRFDHAPLVKFIDRDPSGRIAGGALCASVDRAGRRFPLVLGAPAADGAGARAAADRCEEAIYTAFCEGLDADTLHMKLFAPANTVGTQAIEPRWWVDGQDDEIIGFPGRFPRGILVSVMKIAA